MSRAADLQTLEREAIGPARTPELPRRKKSKEQAGRAGGRARVARQQALRGKLAMLQFALANYVMTSVERLTGPPAQQVAALAGHTPVLVHSLEKWEVPYAPSTDRRALVPFLIAGYTYALLFDQLARPPHRVTEAWAELREDAEQALRKQWGSERGAKILFSRPAPRAAWMANCEIAADGLARLDDRAEDAFVLIRRCENPACPTPFYLFWGPRRSRTCGQARCQAALRKASGRAMPQQSQARNSASISAPPARRSPLVSGPSAH